ncbi:EVE domain-containing protein [Kitasatospora sp. NPDC101183]|uniref:EVE domain-containing protein n=1 Tax=Kitasatospora sp. NPDC101183 TaxID=3364100 RepID=UPI0038175FEE
MTGYWLGVVCRDHVRRGTALGIAQLGHGKHAPLARLGPGDHLIYYSPRTSLHNGEPLQAFTALGEIADGTIWQADEGCFKPWRRRVHYRDTVDVPLADLRERLDLTAGAHWGYQLRRGLIELSEGDFTLIEAAMNGGAVTTATAPQEGLFSL